MKAIILARVSTEEQKEAGNSLPAQIERLQAYCQRKGYEVLEVFSFDESAYKTKRDEFDRIIEVVNKRKEPTVICFDKVDRLSRNVFDKRVSYLYEKAVAGEIELHFVSDGQVINSSISATEKFQFNINLGLAKYYSDAISDNVKRAFEQKRRNGEWSGKARIGYINIKDEHGKKDIVPDPAKSHLIVRAFELYAAGNHSLRTLRDELFPEGLATAEGKPLSASLIGYILQDPFYYGEAVHKGQQYPHKYQPLISRELYDRCQQVRLGWKKKPFQYAAKEFIFRGLLQCAHCNSTITPEIKKGKFIYYSCTNYRKNCKRIYIPEKDLLAPIYEKLSAMSNLSQEVIDEIVSGIKKATEGKNLYHQQALEAVQTEYVALQTRIDRLVDMLADGSITKDIYDRKLKEWKEKQYDLALRLEEHTKADENYHVTAGTVLNLARRALEIFESSEPMEKRALLNYLLQNPLVNGKKLEFTMRKPFDAVIELATSSTMLRR